MTTNANKYNKIGNATKWSVMTEICAKLITPITNMILARLLTPDAFGIVATATMVFSFADMLTDAGFQKYIVQHEFVDEKDKSNSINVAFWSNFIFSIMLWIIISIFSNQISSLVGNQGLGIVIVISCLSLPLTSFSSIQMSLFRREFDFKTLFYVRIVSALLPLCVTIPIAIFTHSFWSIIIGTLCGNIVNAILLTIRSTWKPSFYYNFSKLKEMFSFSIWSLIESISIWLTNYIGIFIVGSFLSSYYLGLYKTSMNTVNQIMNLITTSTTAVLFSSLSRYQNDTDKFSNIFYTFQRYVGYIILPLGIGIFLYNDFVTDILLGSQWKEAAGFIGLWSLVNALKIVLSNYCSEVYRALGKPKVSVFVQVTQLIFLIPLILYGAKNGFVVLYKMRCIVSLELILVNLIIINKVSCISTKEILLNIIPQLLCSLIMIPVSYFMNRIYTGVLWTIISIFVCSITYFILIVILPNTREDFKNIIKLVKEKKNNG